MMSFSAISLLNVENLLNFRCIPKTPIYQTFEIFHLWLSKVSHVFEAVYIRPQIDQTQSIFYVFLLLFPKLMFKKHNDLFGEHVCMDVCHLDVLFAVIWAWETCMIHLNCLTPHLIWICACEFEVVTDAHAVFCFADSLWLFSPPRRIFLKAKQGWDAWPHWKMGNHKEMW